MKARRGTAAGKRVHVALPTADGDGAALTLCASSDERWALFVVSDEAAVTCKRCAVLLAAGAVPDGLRLDTGNGVYLNGSARLGWVRMVASGWAALPAAGSGIPSDIRMSRFVELGDAIRLMVNEYRKVAK